VRKTAPVNPIPTRRISSLFLSLNLRYEIRNMSVAKAHGFIPSIRPPKVTAHTLKDFNLRIIDSSASLKSSGKNPAVGLSFSTSRSSSIFSSVISPGKRRFLPARMDGASSLLSSGIFNFFAIDSARRIPSFDEISILFTEIFGYFFTI